MLLVLVSTLLGQCPAGTLTISFEPPAVLHAEVNDAIHLGLLSAGAAGLKGTCRGIHPDIDTAHETAGKQEVIVLHENNLCLELRALAYLVNLLDKVLTCAVGRMRLAGEEENNGMLGIVHNLAQTL